MISATRYRATAEINRQADLSKEMAKLQTSVSSRKRLEKPSDDPDAASRIAEIRQMQADQVVWTNNVNMGTSISAAADTKLGLVNDSLNRAKELVLSGRNDTTSINDRNAIASELRSIAATLDGYAQSSDPTGAPLFPATTPLAIPVSDTLSLAATAPRTEVFGNVAATSGTKSLQQILLDAATAVEGSSATRATDIQISLNDIDAGSGHISAVRTDQGVRGGRFDLANEQIDNLSNNLTEERSGLESTDLPYAISEYQSKQLSLQAAQTIFAQANKRSLFDLLG